MDRAVVKRARGLEPQEVEAFSRLVTGAARLMSSEQIVELIGALHLEVRRRRDAAAAQWATMAPKLRERRAARR
jgi:hypothetical protein